MHEKLLLLCSSARATLYSFFCIVFMEFLMATSSYFTPLNRTFSSLHRGIYRHRNKASFHTTPPCECFPSFVRGKLKNPHQQEVFTYHDRNFSRGNEKEKLHDEANKNCNELSNTPREAYKNNWASNNKVWLRHDPSERRENRFDGRKIGCRSGFVSMMCCFASC